MKLGNLAVFALTLLAMPFQAARADDAYFLSGAEASRADYYTYLGVIVPGPYRENGKGFFQRYWLDRFGYEYLGAPGKVEADVWGGEAALGYGSPTRDGWWSMSQSDTRAPACRCPISCRRATSG